MISMEKFLYYFLWFYVFLLPCSDTLVLHFSLIQKIRSWGGVAMIFMYVINLLIKKKGMTKNKSKLPYGFLIYFCFFIFWLISSYLWSIDQDATFTVILFYLLLNVPLAFIIMAIVRSGEKITGLMSAYIFGSLISILGTFYAYSHGISFGSGITHRYASEGFDPNDLGLILSLGIPMVWYIVTKEGKNILAWLFYLYIPLAMAAIFLTGSRGALLSAFLGAIVMPLTFSKRPFWLKILLASFVLGIIYLLVQFLPSVTLARFSTIPTELSGGNLSQRIYIWQAGLKVVQDHFFFGVGAGAFPLAMSMFFGGKMVAHNAFLSVLAEEGVVGLVFFVLMLFSLLNRIIFLPSLERNTFLILIFTWIIGASSLTWDYVNQTWFLFSLTAAQISISGGDR